MISPHPTRSLVVFADDWGRHPSSCQHLVRRLRDKWQILWVNSIGTRQVKANGFTFRRGAEKLRSWCRGVRQVSDAMWVLDPPMLPMIENRLSRSISRRPRGDDPVPTREALQAAGLRSVVRPPGFSRWPLTVEDRPICEELRHRGAL